MFICPIVVCVRLIVILIRIANPAEEVSCFVALASYVLYWNIFELTKSATSLARLAAFCLSDVRMNLAAILSVNALTGLYKSMGLQLLRASTTLNASISNMANTVWVLLRVLEKHPQVLWLCHVFELNKLLCCMLMRHRIAGTSSHNLGMQYMVG